MKRNPISKSIRHEVFVKDGFRCVECGATNKQTRLHVDHILPVAQGGTDELINLQTLCEECNLAKSNRMWVGGNGKCVEQPGLNNGSSFMENEFETAKRERIDYNKLIEEARKLKKERLDRISKKRNL